MNSMLTFRKDLKNILIHHAEMNDELNINNSSVNEIIENLGAGELIISVVGEKKRGKSTFLNALLGTTLFPSRATVCTAGVTILDYGETPEAKIIYKNNKIEKINIATDNPSEILSGYITRKNENAKNINVLKIKYPNEFTGNGILLVDTPGVNDPETWREEITYNYLSSSDAVIMLLDPIKPLSASEIEFLRDKILSRSINQLIFVINKIDDVPIEDREKIQKRVHNGINKYIPNPTIFMISSKTALDMRLSGDKAKDNSSGFNNFEEYLLDFLAKGRGGALLATKINKGLSQVNNMRNNVNGRIGALDSEKGEVELKLNEANTNLKKIKSEKSNLKSEILKERNSIIRDLKTTISNIATNFSNSLKKQLVSEPDVNILRSKINNFQKNTIETIEDKVKNINSDLIKKYRSQQEDIYTSVDEILSSLYRSSNAITEGVNVNKQTVRTSKKNNIDVEKGGLIGGAIGGVTGAAAASTLSSGFIIGSTISAGLGTGAILGIGLLTGGLGLLLGAGIASMLKQNDMEKNPEAYISTKTIINNSDAVSSVNQFLNNLSLRTKDIGNTMISMFAENLVIPIDEKIEMQKDLISAIKSDLGKTDDEQKSLRKYLAEQIKKIKILEKEYFKLDENISV